MSDEATLPLAQRRNNYGRRRGKTLRERHRELLRDDLAVLSPGAVERADNPNRVPLDMAARFGGRPVWLEIGFGAGEHLVHHAVRNPGVEFIGCEPFINGVAMLLSKLRAADVSNVAVYPGDVRELFDVLPDGAIARAFLLYPDPWPKQRHVARRFMNAGFLEPLARVLAVGGELRVATDIADYARRTLAEVPASGFTRTAATDDIHQPWDGWLSTRYEKKALRAGRVPHYMSFVRG